MPSTLHADEIDITHALVRSLVDEQFPEYRDLRLEPLGATGSTNALFRLGAEHLVRLPRQPGGSQTIEKEARWVARVAAAVPIAVPDVVAVGEPSLGYPEKWSVVRWLQGYVPGGGSPTLSHQEERVFAGDLGHVVAGLRSIRIDDEARGDSALRWYRGDPLAGLDATTQANFKACAAISGLDLDLDAARRIWADALQLPGARSSVQFSWYHGDLVAENVLIRSGRLSALLDLGGLGVGDPTVDLIAAWDMLSPTSREIFRSVVMIEEEEWLLGRAWALALAVMTFPYYWGTMPARCSSRLDVAHAVIEDARGD